MNNSKKKLTLLLLCISVFTKNICAQDQIYHDDFQQWLGLKLMYNASKRLTLSSQYVCRTNEFLNSFIGSYYYAQARYRLNKHWYPDLQIRVVDNHDGNLYGYEMGLSYRYKLHKNVLFYRLGYFNERKLLMFSRELRSIPALGIDYIPTQYIRNRISIKRDLPKKFTGYASAEIYSQCIHSQLLIKRLAFIAGLDYEVYKNNIFNIEYIYQPDYSITNRVHLQAITLGYENDLPHHFHSKKKKHKKPESETKDRFKDS